MSQAVYSGLGKKTQGKFSILLLIAEVVYIKFSSSNFFPYLINDSDGLVVGRYKLMEKSLNIYKQNVAYPLFIQRERLRRWDEKEFVLHFTLANVISLLIQLSFSLGS